MKLVDEEKARIQRRYPHADPPLVELLASAWARGYETGRRMLRRELEDKHKFSARKNTICPTCKNSTSSYAHMEICGVSA